MTSDDIKTVLRDIAANAYLAIELCPRSTDPWLTWGTAQHDVWVLAYGACKRLGVTDADIWAAAARLVDEISEGKEKLYETYAHGEKPFEMWTARADYWNEVWDRKRAHSGMVSSDGEVPS